jgi:hypothetical protein
MPLVVIVNEVILSRSSWPGLTRPSTSLFRQGKKQGVDHRDKPGDDGLRDDET